MTRASPTHRIFSLMATVAGNDHDRTAGLRVLVSYLPASRAPTSHEFFVGVVFEINLIVFIAAASSEVDHVSVAWVLRK